MSRRDWWNAFLTGALAVFCLDDIEKGWWFLAALSGACAVGGIALWCPRRAA